MPFYDDCMSCCSALLEKGDFYTEASYEKTELNVKLSANSCWDRNQNIYLETVQKT